MEVILASQSPRRKFLLQAAGVITHVRPCDVDESPLPGEAALAMTKRLCLAKAKACDVSGLPHLPVVAADTLVALGDTALGQPRDLADAKRMIQRLSGRQHQVHTTVCVRLGDCVKRQTVSTTVRFRDISDAEIDVYLRHNEVLDKAGAYAIQGGAAGFIQGIEGSLDNVIGLPVAQTLALIDEAKQEVGR